MIIEQQDTVLCPAALIFFAKRIRFTGEKDHIAVMIKKEKLHLQKENSSKKGRKITDCR